MLLQTTNSWVKLKPDYIDEMGKTLDLLILAGYYGHGTRGGKLSNFLVGVADRAGYHENMPEAEMRFLSFCKVHHLACQLGLAREQTEMLAELCPEPNGGDIICLLDSG